MTPFEQINEMKDYIENQRKTTDLSQEMTMETHLEAMSNFLDVLTASLENAEYCYDVQPVTQEMYTLKDYHIMRKKLNDDVIIFQPIAIGEAELSAIDMQSLSDVLRKLRETGKIQEDILIVPPNINIFRAKLAEGQEV